jgi:hypothetical protein
MAPFNLHRERASGNREHPGCNENELSFARASARNQGSIALDLVYQAAEVFRGMEDRARETEARRSRCVKVLQKG